MIFLLYCLDENRSAEEITAELLRNLNMTATNFGGQLDNIDAYREAIDAMIRKALADNSNESSSSRSNGKQEQKIEIPVKIVKPTREEDQQDKTRTTTQKTHSREPQNKRDHP